MNNTFNFNGVKEREIEKMGIFVIDLIRIIIAYVEDENRELYVDDRKFWFATRIIGDHLYILKKGTKNEVLTCIFSINEPVCQSYAIGKPMICDTTDFENMSFQCSYWLQKCEIKIKVDNKQEESIKDYTNKFKLEFLRELMPFLCKYEVASDDNYVDVKKLILMIQTLLKCDYTTKQTGTWDIGGYAAFQVYEKHNDTMGGSIRKLSAYSERADQYYKICRQLYSSKRIDDRIKSIIKENREFGRTVLLTNNGYNRLEKLEYASTVYDGKMYFFNRSILIKLENELRDIIKFAEKY